MAEIPVQNVWDAHFDDFFVKGANGFLPDTFEDELFLTLAGREGTTILTGCSHRGVTNIAAAVRKGSPARINLILGGFHVRDENPEAIGRVVRELERLEGGKARRMPLQRNRRLRSHQKVPARRFLL